MTTTTMTRITTIALSKLTASKDNVRRTQSEAGLTELCASIQAHGLLQNLTVRAAAKGKYEVVAGARRLAALRKLAGRRGSGITKSSPIPVHVLDAENDTEVSLAENTVRVNMHVADQVEAFRKLIDEDAMSPEQVADRFGISVMTVRRRIKLAKVSPRIMDEFRAGNATLQQMEALAVADDHAEQEDAYFTLPEWNRDASHIRNRLTSDKLKASSRFVRFIGIDAYIEAGGTITQDLFTNEDNQFLDDKGLVMKLCGERLEAAAQDIQAEGWKWAEHYLSESDCRQHLPTLPSFQREHTEAESAEVASIMAFIEENEAAYEAGDLTEDETADYEARIARMDAIDAACIGYDPDAMALAGVRVFLNHQGEVHVWRGLLKAEDQHTLAARERAARQHEREAEALANGESFTPEPEQVPETETLSSEQDTADGYSMALISDLTATRTAALAHAVSQRPDVGLALAVHALALRVFYSRALNGHWNGHSGDQTCVRITTSKQARPVTSPDPDNEAVFTALQDARERLQGLLPPDREDLFAWCLEADQTTLLDILAFCVGDQIDAQASDLKAANLRHADAIAEAVDLDMGAWWRPSEGFFKRISKKMIAGAVTEAGCAPEISKAVLAVPKADAIAAALEAIANKGWMPPPLRRRNQLAPAFEADGLADADEAVFSHAAE
jgi:ParB family transcriptional regulator, chromosome partitioning protein